MRLVIGGGHGVPWNVCALDVGSLVLSPFTYIRRAVFARLFGYEL